MIFALKVLDDGFKFGDDGLVFFADVSAFEFELIHLLEQVDLINGNIFDEVRMLIFCEETTFSLSTSSLLLFSLSHSGIIMTVKLKLTLYHDQY